MEIAQWHSRLRTCRVFQDLKAAFPKVTGLNLKVVSALACMVTTPEDPDQHPFCKAVNDSPKGCALCQQAQAQLRSCAGDPPRPCEVQCVTGLTEVGVPVIVGGTHVATLVAGPMLTAQPSAQALKKMLSKFELRGGISTWANVEREYLQIQVLTPEQRAAAQQIMTVIAGQLATSVAPEAVTSSGRYEPACVAFARRYAAEHLSEQMHTHQVARAAHVSLQHFCRVFRQSTGETFTDYLGRQRVDRAKKLLADPQSSIGDVAFACGFRNPTWFGQVFKRQTGKTPRQFRAGMKIHRF